MIIARPETLPEEAEPEVDPAAPWKKLPPEEPADDFRALLKAAAMRYSRPIQIIRRTTWDPVFTPAGQDKPRLQDEATRAWNLHTALYYKAGGVPWRLPRDPANLDNCYVGITFYRSTDHETLQTSVAEVFDQLGGGVIVRGAPAKISRHERQPHLTSGDAQALLTDALSRYRSEHRHLPARVVFHKTSSYTDDEIAGLRAAADKADVDMLEMLWLPPTTPSGSSAPPRTRPLPGQSTTTPATRRERGLAVQKQIVGGERVDAMYEAAPDDEQHLQRYLSANCFGDYLTRIGIDVPTREPLTFAMLASLGGCDAQVKGHVAGNLNVGNDRARLLSVLTVLVPFIGYPRTLNALRALDEVAPGCAVSIRGGVPAGSCTSSASAR